MKSTIFTKVLSEEYIEVNKSVSETIEQLCELCGTVRESLPYDAILSFGCSKNGKIRVEKCIPGWTSGRLDCYFPLHKMYGYVISKDNKTYVQIISIYSRLNLWLQYLLLAIFILFCPLYLLSRIPIARFNLMFFIFLTIITIVASLCGYTFQSEQKKRNLVLLPIMREEIIKRIQIIQSWHN